jgi:hypothetical protein
MTNDEIPKEIRMTKAGSAGVALNAKGKGQLFGHAKKPPFRATTETIRISFVIGYFVIRHLPRVFRHSSFTSGISSFVFSSNFKLGKRSNASASPKETSIGD